MKSILTLSLLLVTKLIFCQTVTFEWLKSVSGGNDDVARGVCLDSLSNIYLTGTFSGSTVIGGQTLVSNGASDIFIAKFDSGGTLVWAKSFGSVSLDYAFDIDCEPSGIFYITGGFRQTMNLPVGVSISSTGSMDYFTSKFDSNGNCLWAKTAIGNASEYGNEIVVTPNNYICAIGNTEGTLIFPSDTLSHTDSTDLFVVKYDNAGNKIWSRGIGGGGIAGGRAVSSDDQENTLIAGSFEGTWTIDTVTFSSSSVPNNDIFIAKLSPAGTLRWATKYGGFGDDYARGIDADAFGNIYVSGVFSDSIHFGGINLTANGASDIFLLKLDSNGNQIWVKQIGNNGAEEGCEIEVNDLGKIVLTGEYSQSIDLGPAHYSSSGVRDVFIAMLDSSGNFVWSESIGSSADDVNYAIGFNALNEDVCSVGTFSGTFTDNTHSITSAGGIDSYISKIKTTSLVGVHERVSDPNRLTISPNPANTFIKVTCKNGFHIMNSTGQVVRQSTEETDHINIADLPEGMYFITGNNQVGRFFINH